ncbi:hypothetical protein QYE76_067472 [Lolium multiflorum]|uniref:CCHC-type domain-containing protein n=1 Tax=Lolium multiflorum TaxID=4521 RepID=A0AAD8WD17_LOLMU|nr:hypothetical protein QYE76_067472 [Lolium multiflorum]
MPQAESLSLFLFATHERVYEQTQEYEDSAHLPDPSFLGSRALRRRSRLLHPVYRRAPLDGTAGLRNPVSCDHVRERCDKVFVERSSATAGFDIDTEAGDYFPNDDFFPDISSLFSDMALNSDNVNAGSSTAPHYSPVSFASSLKPPPFEGVNYKRWRARAILWLTTMRCFDATKGKPEGELTPLEEKAFEDADTLLRGAIISVLGENIVDSYLSISTGKDMWDAIEAKFGVSDAGSELYVMEQFYDFKMTNERSIVEQAHEIQSIAKELEKFTCVLPDKFIAGVIIAKLPPSWRNFATSLKHKRQEFSTIDLIGPLDVEEKARAKDTRARGVEGGSSANLVQKKNFQSYKSKNKNKYDGKGKFDGKNKASQSTNFKRKTDKKKGVCHVCGDPDHWAPNCPNRFDKRQQGKGGKTVNVVIGDTDMKDVGSQGLPLC